MKDYRVESAACPCDQNSSPIEDNIIDVQAKEERVKTAEDVCRVCFSSGTKDNPLLSLCNCTGSAKFIHYLCLKTWLNSKVLEKVDSDLIAYYWRNFQCEICTLFYPCTLR